MAFSYSARSRAVRDTLQLHLQNIFDEVLLVHDHSQDCGARSPEDQQAAFERGASQWRGINLDGTVANYPHAPRDSNGNPHPAGRSWALDVWPWAGGRRVDAPDIPDIIRRVGAGDASAYVKKALLGYMQFAYFIRLVLSVAEGYFEAHRRNTGERWSLRSGSDWDMDGDITDTKFLDAPHFELRFEGLEER